ncbi:hypothetical protein JOC36_001061 [Weissella uvarum]|uniref:hypothetical protein n=1 Tax=Weissella uvarum TaxID=1479233 RepID=UPI00196205FA|nr:hypothetical protein [Weissella uvarum]MBM7617504.1 hypothetical protein [Weissella uvarum]MCM0595612.1 hypothetical protein [Weissella uvarum]
MNRLSKWFRLKTLKHEHVRVQMKLNEIYSSRNRSTDFLERQKNLRRRLRLIEERIEELEAK